MVIWAVTYPSICHGYALGVLKDAPFGGVVDVVVVVVDVMVVGIDVVVAGGGVGGGGGGGVGLVGGGVGRGRRGRGGRRQQRIDAFMKCRLNSTVNLFVTEISDGCRWPYCAQKNHHVNNLQHVDLICLGFNIKLNRLSDLQVLAVISIWGSCTNNVQISGGWGSYPKNKTK